MTNSDKTIIANILGFLAACGVYCVWNLRQQIKISKRMKRSEAFLAESVAFRLKYCNIGDDEELQKIAIREFEEIMDRYEI